MFIEKNGLYFLERLDCMARPKSRKHVDAVQSNEIPGIEYRNGDDGYAAISKYQNPGPVRSQNSTREQQKKPRCGLVDLNAAYCYSQMGRYTYIYI